MTIKSKRDWFELGYVFDFETRCLKNYKTGEIANIRPPYNWLADEVCSFSYEEDLDKYLHRCVTKERKWFFFTKEYYDFPESNYISGVAAHDYVYYVNGENRGFCCVDDEFIFDKNTLWCNMEEYYELTNKWYDIAEVDFDEWLDSSYDTFEHLETISSYVKPFKGITWLER